MTNIQYKNTPENQKVLSGLKLKIVGVFLIPLVAMLFSSCERILEEGPKLVAEESFYNTSLEVETAVNAIYEPLRQLPDAGIVGINSALDEMCYGRGSWAWLNQYDGLNSTWVTRTSNMWGPLYLAIRNANLVIRNVPLSSILSQTEKDIFVGEAKFLRAFAYFQLVRNWGSVPIRTDGNFDTVDVPKSSVDKIYQLIISDLSDAEMKLADEERLRGVASKWAAKTLLSDVYLNIGKYSESRDKAYEVISSGKYALFAVKKVGDFQSIFGPNTIKNSEEIFYSLYSHVSGLGNIWPGLLNHPRTGLYGNAGVYGVHGNSENPAFKKWDENDLRKELWYPQEFGVAPTTLLSRKFIDPESPGLAGGSNPITWYRYADVLLIYAEAEGRVNGVTAEAIEAVNKVHRRAYGLEPEKPAAIDFEQGNYNSESFLDLVLKERGYEFQLEGKRWPDLKRTGKAVEIIKEVWGVELSQKNYLWPIPVNEFNFNQALDGIKDQNPGY